MAMAMAKKPCFLSSAPTPSSEWPDRAVSLLLKTYAQKFSVDRGYLRTQDWQDVAHAVNSVCDHPKTMKQCRDKVDSLKRRYKIEKRKAVAGGEVSWPFFHRLDEIMNAVLKQGRIQCSSHPNQSSGHASADADGADDLDVVDEAADFRKGMEEIADAAAHPLERHDVASADDSGDASKDDSHGLNYADRLSAASSDVPPYWKSNKPLRCNEVDYDMSEEEDDAFNGCSSQHLPHFWQNRNHQRQQPNSFRSHGQSRPKHGYHDYFLQPPVLVPSGPSTLSGGTQESTENANPNRRVKKSFGRRNKRKHEGDLGIDALADALTGLSKPHPTAALADVLAGIDFAKAAILKKMRVELTKLSKTHKKSNTSRKVHSSLATSC